MSKSWRLQNVKGLEEFEPGFMDIELVDGSVTEITNPVEVLNQRLQKCAIEPQGTNRFARGWGSVFRLILGEKALTESVLKEIGASIRVMTDELIAQQRDSLQRLNLALGELIERVDKVVIRIVTSSIKVSIRVVTQAGTVEEIIVGVPDVL